MAISKSTNKSPMMPSTIWRIKSSTRIQSVHIPCTSFEKNHQMLIFFACFSFAQERLSYFNLWKISQQTINNLEVEINQYLKQSNNSESLLTVRIPYCCVVVNFCSEENSVFVLVFSTVKKAHSSFRTKNRGFKGWNWLREIVGNELSEKSKFVRSTNENVG